jgi:hypothetical protein
MKLLSPMVAELNNDSVTSCNLAWHDLSPVNISVVTMASYFISRIDIFFGIPLFCSPGRKKESQCKEVDKLYDADETESHEEAADAAEVT